MDKVTFTKRLNEIQRRNEMSLMSVDSYTHLLNKLDEERLKELNKEMQEKCGLEYNKRLHVSTVMSDFMEVCYRCMHFGGLLQHDCSTPYSIHYSRMKEFELEKEFSQLQICVLAFCLSTEIVV